MGEVKSWASILDEATRLQAEVVSRAPGIAGHLALMPDAHLGIGATVGSVIPTWSDTIIPAAVGVDIGCGMIAARTDLQSLPEDLRPLVGMFGRSIPAGVGRDHSRASRRAEEWFEADPVPDESVFDSAPVPRRGRGRKRDARSMIARGKKQLGTLGSGNHFVEVCLDEAGAVWIRAPLGFEGHRQRHRGDLHRGGEGRERGGAGGREHGAADGQLVHDVHRDDGVGAEVRGDEPGVHDGRGSRGLGAARGEFDVVERINCHHNFAALEEHFGREVWITRKGAIKADTGDLGIIPGSMGTSTYIVEGKGNPDSYKSSAHGAGRMYSRSKARKTFTTESLRAMMEGKAWNANSARKLLDEHPDAYKPIEQVMEDQDDLVSVKKRLTQVVNYKGT